MNELGKEPLWTRREVASFFRVSTRTVDRICRDRTLRFYRVGGRKRFDPADVRVYLVSRKFGGE
ncbi:MAG: helix-turn-helix domain-containing protein [Acidobacteria bacterium]|nr:helix-turn-helix domain-containing protein [Acidobacteriota bacterium]